MKKIKVFVRTKWIIDPSHSEVGFKVKHLEFSTIRGKFREFDASIYTKGDDFMTARIDFWLNPDSIDTGDILRDLHLKSPDFLHVDQFKVIHFCASHYARTESNGRYEMNGELTMKGITKAIKLDVEYAGIIKDPNGKEKSIFNIKGPINRKKWGMNWNDDLESGGILISEEVWIECDVELIKQV